MSSNRKPTEILQDLILFYVKENYFHYLTQKNIQKIPDNEIKPVVINIYSKKKDHLKKFLKDLNLLNNPKFELNEIGSPIPFNWNKCSEFFHKLSY